MAINPALIKAAVQVVTSEKGRKGLLIAIFLPIGILMLIICFIFYILTAPFQFLSDTFDLSLEEKAAVQNAQISYSGYLMPENKVLDRGGFYPYPTEGTTGSRGFSATPVHHPVLGISRPHWGQDFNTEWHSNVYAIADGKVFNTGVNDEAGMFLTIYHDVNGKQFFTRYLHLSAVHVLPDSRVRQGDVVASEGGEPGKDMYPGTSTGHHLHFEVREGSTYSSAVPVDPKLYIDPIPVEISCTSGSGSIKVNITGGRDRGYEISIDGGKTWEATFDKSYTFKSLNNGSYNVVARDWSYQDNISKVSPISVRK
ncbi:MAG TPA: M23 family metallopeptidase [Ruminiclostridium sp.]|nr:M23 family metallopeptidase [Ruminiclostridium sp.]